MKFYGTNLQHSRNGTEALIVLELCSCSLRSWIISNPKNAPARSSSDAIKKKVLGWVLNVLDALQYIHDEGFVHGDLNLDNILVSWIPKISSRTHFFSLSFLSISLEWLGNGLIKIIIISTYPKRPAISRKPRC